MNYFTINNNLFLIGGNVYTISHFTWENGIYPIRKEGNRNRKKCNFFTSTIKLKVKESKAFNAMKCLELLQGKSPVQLGSNGYALNERKWKHIILLNLCQCLDRTLQTALPS